MSDTRELTTLMFTDMVGFTSATQQNEANALALLARQQRLLRSVLPRFRGREIKTMGDGFLVEFSSALEATLCAIEIQRSVREANRTAPSDGRIDLRIGLHLGDVVRRGRDVVGDAVNVASRIEPLADAGGICLSEEVYAQVHNKLGTPLASLGSQRLKNVRLPMDVYKVVLPWEAEPARREVPEASVSPAGQRVAILPFVNMSPDPADEYFADGLTEEVTMAVSNLSRLQVIARTSMMSFKTKAATVREIGRTLEVASVLEGSVRKVGDELRVTAKLIDVASESQVWSAAFDRRFKGILRIQGEIAAGIAGALRLRLASSEKKEIGRRPTDDLEAYTSLLRGESLLEQANTDHDIMAARDAFDQTLERDPQCVAALVGRSRAQLILWIEGFRSGEEVLREGEASARRALRIDPNAAEAHLALAAARLYSWDFPGAERASRKAIELKPNLARAHSLRARILAIQRRFEEAEPPALRALALDPLSAPAHWLAGSVYLFWGRPAEGLPLLRRAVELAPRDTNGYENLGICLLKLGRAREGLAELETADRLASGRDPMVRTSLAWAYVHAGAREKARRVLEEMRSEVEQGRGYATALAGLHAILGENDQTFAWLERARREHLGVTPFIMLAIWFDSVRGDRRFGSFVRRMKGGGTSPRSSRATRRVSTGPKGRPASRPRSRSRGVGRRITR